MIEKLKKSLHILMLRLFGLLCSRCKSGYGEFKSVMTYEDSSGSKVSETLDVAYCRPCVEDIAQRAMEAEIETSFEYEVPFGVFVQEKSIPMPPLPTVNFYGSEEERINHENRSHRF